jgi:hypothetical protein
MKASGSGIEVPDAHLADGLARATAEIVTPFIAIHSSRDRPSHASIAVMHKGWWFFVDERDARSKQAFIILRTLIGLRLDEGTTGQVAPVLTVPVAR